MLRIKRPTFGNKFNSQKCTHNLKMVALKAVSRKNQKDMENHQLMNSIAESIKTNNIGMAKTRAQRLIHDKKLSLAYEDLKYYCEMLIQRMDMVQSQNQCPSDMISVIHTILYCQPRLNIPELNEVKNLLTAKYGKDWIDDALNDRQQQVYYRMVQSLSLIPSQEPEINQQIKDICQQLKIPYEDDTPPFFDMLNNDNNFNMGSPMDNYPGGIGGDRIILPTAPSLDDPYSKFYLDNIYLPEPTFSSTNNQKRN